MSEPTWYIRNRGRVTGPFTKAQLSAMRLQGKFARFHEVSTDRQSWVGAATLSDIFAAASSRDARSASPGAAQPGGSASTPGADDDSATLLLEPEEPDLWHYSHNGSPAVAVAFEQLQQMAARGEINGSTWVWKDGMASWVPASQVAGLNIPPAVAPSAAPVPSFAAVSPTSVDPQWATPASWQGNYATPPRTSGLAVASLVLSLLWLCGIGSLLAVIFAIVALNGINQSPQTLTGKGLAVAGLVLGILGALPLIPILFR